MQRAVRARGSAGLRVAHALLMGGRMQPTPSYPPQPHAYPPPAAAASNTHVIGGALLLLSALLVSMGLVTKSFVSASHGDSHVDIGYLGAQACEDGHCRSFDWDELGDVKSDIKAVRWIGLLGGVGAIGVSIVAAIFAFQRKQFPGAVLHAVLGVAAFAFMYFAIRWIGEGKGDFTPLPGLSFALAFSGVILGSVMQATLLRNLAGRR